ncbi:hypothetical protein P7L91_09785 [Bisgaard Taxon 10/6]|uniref:hypothetical protein n=1 Tax=Exercitatus varius TaxID=67857 RepID=UPI00294AAFD9|nr:hypothetical protein [Exercitatus varius]MDG2961122.1 hypothetical protein [Exercitatus varius]
MTSNTNKNRLKALAYSIRKRGEDEIEIRDSLFDGYARGFIRFVLGGMMLINILFNGPSVIPFYSHSETKRDYAWAFHRDEMLMEEYKYYKEMTEETNKFREEKLELTPYEIYTDGLGPQSPLKDFILDIIMIPFMVFAFFLPRPRGFRVNRKKRVIYWQTILGSHSIAFVPETGDPLGGINYSRFGLYAFGEHERFSLQLWINDYFTKRRATAWFGVYPSPSSEHNAQILRAIRAYLTEENPEFLNYVGRDYKNFGLKFNIALCNAFALRVPFNRKKADAAIEKALDVWNKKTPNQKQGWFNDIRGYQKIINENHQREDLDNVVE